MKKIQISNFKSIHQSPMIELKPLNILIGKNSCGKSSFLRVFPLLKQSLEKPINDPILWYGDYVDFGSFQNTISSAAGDKEPIVFSFCFDSNVLRRTNHLSDMYVTIGIKDKYVEFYKFDLGENQKIELRRNKDSKYVAFINGQEIEHALFSQRSSRNNLLWIRPESGDDETRESFYYNLIIDQTIFNGIRKKVFNSYYDSLFSQEAMNTLIEIAKNEFKEDIDDNYKKVERIITPMLITHLLDDTRNLLVDYFSSVQYFQPLRARADRFYRVQGISINEVDSDGINAPMILYSMSPEERKKFEEWSISCLGFAYTVTNIGNSSESASMMIKMPDGEIRNLADVGFGYSQILPIIISIWKAVSSSSLAERVRTANRYKTVVIEQPELHLHPAFQQQVMSLILKLIKSTQKKYKLTFIIETHSESIINYIGRKIIKNEFSSSDINLYYLEKDNNETIFNKLEFDSNGIIVNWPVGFFTYED